MVLIGAAVKSVLRYLNKPRAGDSDSKWSVHYTTQKSQRQRLVFIPGKRRSGSAEDLRACNRLTQHIYSRPASSHLHQPSPASPLFSFDLDQSEGSTHKRDKSRKRSSDSSDEEQNFVLNNAQPLTTLVLNPVASCQDIFASTNEATVDEELEPSSRLPTPEERMRRHAETVPADIVPINITGESFDRQASLRRTLSNVDSLPRQTQNRKAVIGVPDAINKKMDSSLGSMVLSDHSFVGGPSTSSCISNHQQKNTEAQQGKKTEIQKGRQSLVRRIQAPRGDGMSSLMASLTSSPKVDEPSTSSKVNIFSRLPTNSSLNSESSSNSSPDRTLSVFQDKQGFHSDHQPLRLLDSPTGVCPQTVSPSSSLLSSQNITLKPDWSYPCNKPLAHISSSSSHHFSSSSITNSESQFSYQAVDDYTQQSTHCSCDGERLSYQPLSSSSTVHSDQTGSEWSGIAQEMRCVSPKGWSCKPLLSCGRSSPAYPKSTSLCSEKTTSFLSPNCEKRKSSISSSCSCSVTRSISLRKSKRPPPPPIRSDSLRRKTDHNKSSQFSSSPPQEDIVQMTPSSSPQTFHNPWVPRSNVKIHQCGLNCRTVTTFEPLDFKTVPSVDSPLSTCRTDTYVLTGSPCTEVEVLRYTHPLGTSFGFQRHTSPSSGYSSQSNTPTPGTPLSSPLTPSSPQTASPGVFSLPLISPFPPSQSCSFPPSPTISSLYRTNSHAKVKAKPPVPERKSSLFSSLSSPFSSTSSLSSYTSSESSTKHSLLPPPPPPPPLPKCSSLSSLVLYSPISTSLSQAPPLLHSYLPAPLPPSFRLPPPPYSYAIRQTSNHAIVFTESPNNLVPPTTFPPPLFPSELSPHPPPPPAYHLPQSLRESQNYYIKAAMLPCPLVTAQALEGIKLSSAQNPEVEHKAICNNVQSNKTHLNQANSNQPVKEAIPDNSMFDNDLHYFANTDVKLAGIGSENSVCNLNKTKTSTDLMANANSLMFGNTDGKQPGHVETSTTNESADANKCLQDFVYGFTNQRHCGPHVTARPDIQSNEQNSNVIVLLTKKHIPTSNSPGDEIGAVIQYVSPQQEQGGVKMSADTKLTVPTENVCDVDSSSCSLSQSKQMSLRGNEAKLSERKDEVQTKTRSIGADLMTSCSQEVRSPERPVLPKKPDLCILGLSMSPEARPGGCRNSGKTTEPSFGLINEPPQLPQTLPQHLNDNSSTSVSTTHRQKPPILHKKPDVSLTSPRTTKSLFASENTVEAFKTTSKTGTTTQTSALGIIGTTGTVERSTFKCSPNTINGTMSILENSDTSGTRDALLENSETTVNLGDTAGSTKTACEQIYRPRLKKDDETIFQQEMMRSSLAEEEEEEPRKTKTTMMVLMPSFTKKKSRKKRKRRRAGRQLLMSSTVEPTPSSSSPSSSSSSLLSSSSSGDEHDVTRENMTGMIDPEMSHSVVSCTLNGQSRYSLRSAPSNNSLQGELSLPDLLIQETNEVEEEVKKVHSTPDADLFISISAEQMFVSGQPRTTEDLFAVIHRSKRKMLGRRDSLKDKHSISSSPTWPSSSSSSPPVTPTDPCHLIRPPAASRSQRSARSESFKALLLRKGSRSHLSSRTSAAERLCKVAISATANDHQIAPPLPPPHRLEVKASSSSFMADKQQLTLDTPASSCSMNVLVMLRQRDLRHSHLLLTSSSPFLFLSPSSSSIRPRVLTPPCSSSRHFTARCRLFATPMTAIFEGENEEEKDDDKVFIESAEGGQGELGQGMVEIS